MLEVIFFSLLWKYIRIYCANSHMKTNVQLWTDFNEVEIPVSVLFLSSSRKHLRLNPVDLYCELIDLSLYR